MYVVRMLLLGIAAGLALAAGAAGAPQKESATLYGLLTRSGADDLVRIDPDTLRPVGKRLAVGEFGTAWAFSPDHSRLALGWSYTATLGRVGAIRIVDLRRWRSEREIILSGELSSLQAVSWVGNRLVALVSYPRESDVIAIDPRTGRVLARRTLDGLVAHAVPTVRGLTLLAAPRAGLGPARIVLVDSALRVRSATIDRVRIGSGVTENEAGELIAGRSNHAGFALRSGASRALGYVLGAGAPPAVVDLRTLSVDYAATRTLARTAKSSEGSFRFAEMVGSDAVAFGGLDYAVDGRSKRVGVSLLDARSWVPRPLDANATAAAAGAGVVLTWDGLPSTDRTLGVRAFGAEGALRFAALPGLSVGDVQISGERALARLSGRRSVGKVLNLRSGAVVTTMRGNVPQLLLGSASTW